MVAIVTVPPETKLDAYPNPASQQFTIRFSRISDRVWTITIADLSGHLVHANAVQSLNNLVRVKYNKTLLPVLYIIKLGNNEQTLLGKLLIR
jgi:hypothetical protein